MRTRRDMLLFPEASTHISRWLDALFESLLPRAVRSSPLTPPRGWPRRFFPPVLHARCSRPCAGPGSSRPKSRLHAPNISGHAAQPGVGQKHLDKNRGKSY